MNELQLTILCMAMNQTTSGIVLIDVIIADATNQARMLTGEELSELLREAA